MPRELLAPRIAPRVAASLRRRLLTWYRRHRRDLPWRATRDPYAIWVSEVMLQQTQVATAQPFYLRFLERFPTLTALARAGEADVLAHWAGLGYYRRARNLHAATRLVVREHSGRVPKDPEVFGRLPGVGRYTTGAVLSIAFDQPLPVLDGNVARVLSRLFAVRATAREPRGARALWALAARLVPMRRAGDWNQALMELGATICTPRAPLCADCPVRGDCRALATGRVAEFPRAAARQATVQVRRALALIERRGRVLVVQRHGRQLEGLWEPPGVELANGESAAPALRAELERLGVSATLSPTRSLVRHTITRHAIRVEVWRGTLRAAARASRLLRFVDPAAPRVALTALARKVARQRETL